MLLGYNTVKKFSGIYDRTIEPLLGEMLNLLFITRSQFWCSRLEIILWVRIVQVEVLHGSAICLGAVDKGDGANRRALRQCSHPCPVLK